MTEPSIRAFSKGEALRFGWEKTKANLKPLLVLGVIGAVLALFQQGLAAPNDGAAMRSLMSIILQVIQTALMLAYVRFALALNDGAPLPDLSRWADLLADFFTYLMTTILLGLIVAVGMVLLVVPGVIWGLKFGYAPFLVVDKKLDPIDALKESARLTNGIKGQLFVFALLLFGVNLLGLIALGIGTIVTVPTTVIAAAYVLRRLQARASARPAPEPPALPAPPTPAHT